MDENNLMEVNFAGYCYKCKNFYLDEWCDPCNECLSYPCNEYSVKPVMFEPTDEKVTSQELKKRRKIRRKALKARRRRIARG